ncbi:MAG TPA: DUF4232 domain-containing protein [Candidatus Dormibacteraeota bacterium]|nr:DUF4232 domain-containing protein [Candidatus Dormibacteraeota bacterium]
MRAPAATEANVIPWIAATPSAATPTPRPTIPVGTPTCMAQNLSAQFDGGQGLGGGQLVASVSFMNRGDVACYLQGVPSLSLIDAQGHLIQTHNSGYLASNGDDPVLLAAHGTTRQASVSIVWPAIDITTGGGDCPAPAAATIRVGLPRGGEMLTVSTAQAAMLQITVAPCRGAIAVGAFQAVEAAVEPTPVAHPFAYHLVAPASVRAGSDLHYTISLTNITKTAATFDSCPVYQEDLYAGDGAAGPPLGKHLYVLNCRPVGSMSPGTTVTFAMVLDVPSSAPTGRYTLLWSNLSPGTDIHDVQRVPIEIAP